MIWLRSALFNLVFLGGTVLTMTQDVGMISPTDTLREMFALGAEALAECLAFYARDLACSVGGLPATPQPGGFYGGWITDTVCGPFKGEPGTRFW